VSPAAVGQANAAALGIAMSPVTIATVIVLLLSPRAKSSSIGFLLGWSFGIAAAVTAFALLAGVVPLRAPGAARSVLGVIELVAGVLLLVAAAIQWRRRDRVAGPPTTPGWMRTIDRITLPVAFALGCVMAVNPPNLLLSLAGGIAIGSSELSVGGPVAAITLFTVVAASTVLVPVIGHFIAADRLRRPLASLRAWLTRHNSVILTVVFAAVGALLVTLGIIELAAA